MVKLSATQIREKKCNALIQNSYSDHEYCEMDAGSGTEHSGIGRCISHDNKVEGIATLAPFHIASIEEKQREFLYDKNIYSLNREIALLRTHVEILGYYIDILKAEHKAKSPIEDSKINIESLTSMLNKTAKTIGELVQAKHDIEVGRKYVVHVDIFNNIVVKIADIIDKNVEDVETRVKIHKSLQQLALPAPEL